MSNETNRQPQPAGTAYAGRRPVWSTFLIGPAFFALAAWMIWQGEGVAIPPHQPVVVKDRALPTTPQRDLISDPPTIRLAGFDQGCMHCHRLFEVRGRKPGTLLQHQHIELDHGTHHDCAGCHNTGNMSQLLLSDGTTISFDQVAELCQDCHGVIYQDWLTGAHGRTNGYWNDQQGDAYRLACTQCHDPHVPRLPVMDKVRTLPGPTALRQVVPAQNTHVHDGSDATHEDHD